MDILKTKIHFINKELLLYSFLVISFLLFVFNLSDTFTVVSNLLGGENITIDIGSTSDFTNIFSIVSPEVATFILWAILGLVAFFIVNIVYTVFLHPLINDLKESTYINSKKELLLEKRIIWIMLIILSIFLLVISVALFIFIAMPYYTIFLGERNIQSFAVLFIVIFICSLCISLVKSTLEAIIKTY